VEGGESEKMQFTTSNFATRSIKKRTMERPVGELPEKMQFRTAIAAQFPVDPAKISAAKMPQAPPGSC
jgi:hypothetical protein